MIDRIEVCHILRHDLEGVHVTFVYDTNISDSYEIMEPNHEVIINLMAESPDPNMFMLTIRNLMNLTIH